MCLSARLEGWVTHPYILLKVLLEIAYKLSTYLGTGPCWAHVLSYFYRDKSQRHEGFEGFFWRFFMVPLLERSLTAIWKGDRSSWACIEGGEYHLLGKDSIKIKKIMKIEGVCCVFLDLLFFLWIWCALFYDEELKHLSVLWCL